jgi:hypothetical protein
MKWLFIAPFVIGCWFQLRALGAPDKRTRRIFWVLSIALWLLLLVLANTLL